ncbi:MAG: hemerythrin domain-containing protein [Nitrospirota bacterium]|jgi:hemerythrin-like domain-containing protein
MSKLVEELKRDHVLMVDMLNKVKELGITKKEGQDILISAKANLLAHLKKEDRDLYPVLKKAAETNSSMKQTLEIFARDMEEISKFALQFFDKYSHGGSGIEFARDFGKLFATLTGRIRKEEDILYREYEKISQ